MDDDDEDEDGYNLDAKCLPYHQPLQEQEEKHGEEKKKAESQNLSFYQQPTLCKHSALHKSGVWSKVHVMCLHWKQYICEWDEQV